MKRIKLKPILFQIHLWIGLILCLPLVALGITGSYLVIGDKLAPAHYDLAVGRPHSPLEILETAQKKSGQKPSMIRMPNNAETPAMVRFGKGAKPLFIDPVSLKIIEQNPSGGLLGTIHKLHANALIEGPLGRNIIGWLGVIMLALGISGLILWWPKRSRWKAAFLIKRGAKGHRLYRDWHGAAGIWMWLVFIAVSFSGTYLAFPQTLGALFPGRDLRANVKVEPLENAKPIAVDQAIRLAQSAFPDASFFSLSLPSKKDQPYRVMLRPADYEEGSPAITVFIDPWQANIIEIRNPQTYGIGEKLQAWQHAVHAGEGLGLIWKSLVFVAGFLPLLFSITGIAMWLIKRQARRR